MPNVLLTGASGFIGSRVLAALVTQEYPVLVLARNPAHIASPAHIISCDLRDITLDVASKICAFRPHTVIHTAWLGTENTERNHPEFMHANLHSSLRLLEIVMGAGCNHWIGFGSQAEYSPHLDADITEDAPTFPDTAYGVAKLATCHTLKNICSAHPMSFTWLRLFASYGNDYHASYVMPYLVSCFSNGDMPVLKTPHAQWDYIHVDDVVDAALSALTQPQASHGIFNLGTGTATAIGDIALQLAGMTGFSGIDELRRHIDDVRDTPSRRVADITRIMRALRWVPSVSLAEGLARLCR